MPAYSMGFLVLMGYGKNRGKQATQCDCKYVHSFSIVTTTTRPKVQDVKWAKLLGPEKTDLQ